MAFARIRSVRSITVVSTVGSFLFAVFLGPGLRAEVVSSSLGGFAIRETVEIHSVPRRVYRALTGEVKEWWNPEHTFSGDSRNLSLDARPNGCFCERLEDGGGVVHATVVNVSPGRELRLNGALGPLQELGVAGTMSFVLKPSESGTSLEFSYQVGGYLEGGLASWAGPVNNVLVEQLRRLKEFVEARSGN